VILTIKGRNIIESPAMDHKLIRLKKLTDLKVLSGKCGLDRRIKHNLINDEENKKYNQNCQATRKENVKDY
jgi:hypothetical protein